MDKKFMAKIATSLVAVMLITACSSGGEQESNNTGSENQTNTEEPASNEGANNSENSAE